jgi:hypothetical protein
MDKHRECVKLAAYHCNYKWPKELFTGIMYFNGHRITVEEFQAWSKLIQG